MYLQPNLGDSGLTIDPTQYQLPDLTATVGATDPNAPAAVDTSQYNAFANITYGSDAAAASAIAAQATSGGGLTDPNILQSLLTAAPQVVTGLSQLQLLSIQAQRAAKGLPPLNSQQYGLGVNVGLSSQTQMLLIGGAILLYFMLKRR